MADDPKNVGKPDRDLVSQEKHEIDYLVQKTGATREEVIKAIKEAGPSRDAVEKRLGGRKAS